MMRILLIDDQSEFQAICLRESLNSDGDHFEITEAPTLVLGRTLVASDSWDLILLDIAFGDGGPTGLDKLPEFRALAPNSFIMMLSDHNDKQCMIEARLAGADDYIVKSRDGIDGMRQRIEAHKLQRQRKHEVPHHARQLAQKVGAVFKSRAMLEVFESAYLCKQALDLNVLILGPTGSGKEKVAQAIGDGRPFVAVNCAAIPENLIESELFGHEKGSFTGAVQSKPGKFELASGGTIFLDEVAKLSLKAQAALLRVIQEQELERVGDNRTRKIRVRVVAATNEDLTELQAKGEFREDLLARIAAKTINLPPLQARPEDIAPIVRMHLNETGRSNTRATAELVSVLETFEWPQNVRQLRQLLRVMTSENTSDCLSLADIPLDFLSARQNAANDRTVVGSGVFRNSNAAFLSLPTNITYDEAHKLMLIALIQSRKSVLGPKSNQSSVAKSLQLPRVSLQRYLKSLKIEC